MLYVTVRCTLMHLMLTPRAHLQGSLADQAFEGFEGVWWHLQVLLQQCPQGFDGQRTASSREQREFSSMPTINPGLCTAHRRQ